MELTQLGASVLLVLIVAALVKVSRRRGGRRRGRGRRPGPGAAGAVYEMLNEDKRRAIEIIVEEKAGERDAETADGNLPELEKPE